MKERGQRKGRRKEEEYGGCPFFGILRANERASAEAEEAVSRQNSLGACCCLLALGSVSRQADTETHRAL